jgi:hypothetical protein
MRRKKMDRVGKDFNLEKFKKVAQEQQKKIRENTQRVKDELKRYYETGTFVEMVCKDGSGRYNCRTISSALEGIIGVVLELDDGTVLKFGVTCPYFKSSICILTDKGKKKEL